MAMPNWPVFDKENEIVRSVTNSQATIIVGPTGSGKSLGVPEILCRRVLMSCVITEPRRFAARSLADYAAKLDKTALGEVVGYRTGFEQCDFGHCQRLYITDGLELVREIHGHGQYDILVIDEVHEWNVNIETLIAWSKKRLVEDSGFRVVIMSATMEAEQLAAYFGDANIVEVDGRLFPVEELLPSFGGNMAQEAAQLARQGKNVLMFQPGKAEIYQAVEELEKMDLQARILPLHGELDVSEQDRVFQSSFVPTIIVATNIAQTSVTIDYINAVIDSSTEKRMEKEDGVEVLRLRRISRADELQRLGRAGRCQSGVYINCYTGMEKQLDQPIPEIDRVRLDQLVLRLAVQGFDATELEFFHQPSREELADAKRNLKSLDAFDDNGEVTQIGKGMAKFPVSVEGARMVIEALIRHCPKDVLTGVACMEVGGIHSKKKDDTELWQALTHEGESDLLAQKDLFQVALGLRRNDDMRSTGIHPKSFWRAKEIREKLCEVLIEMACQSNTSMDLDMAGEREQVLNCFVRGMLDHVYVRSRTFQYTNGQSTERQLDNKSVVWAEPLVVGRPLGLEVPDRFSGGMILLDLVVMATKTTLWQLKSLAPHLYEVKLDDWKVVPNAEGKKVTASRRERFNGVAVDSSFSAETIEIAWSDVKRYLDDGMTIEDVRQQIIDRQWAEAIQSFGLLRERSVDVYLMDQSHFQPIAFGTDPATGRSLLAYPAIVRDAPFSFSEGWRLKYCRTQKEAQAEQRTFDQKFTFGKSHTALNDSAVAIFQTVVEKTSLATNRWEHLGRRDWRCPNGHTTRAAKKATKITCEFCEETHEIPQ